MGRHRRTRRPARDVRILDLRQASGWDAVTGPVQFVMLIEWPPWGLLAS